MNLLFQKYSPGAARKKIPSVSGRARRAFTLLEVMIAVMILFMCLFGELALLSNSLASARRIQQAHKGVDVGTVSGLLYVQLINTNQLNEGRFDVDVEDVMPGYQVHPELTLVGTNGLCRVDFDVEHHGQMEMQSQFLIYLPNMKVGGISRSLPQH